MSKLAIALVLCDVLSHDLKAGQLVEADAATIKALAAEGSLDVHKEAVAAARSRGAELVRSAIEQATEQRAADTDAKRVELAQLQDLHAKAADPETAAALAKKIAETESALADLVA